MSPCWSRVCPSVTKACSSCIYRLTQLGYLFNTNYQATLRFLFEKLNFCQNFLQSNIWSLTRPFWFSATLWLLLSFSSLVGLFKQLKKSLFAWDNWSDWGQKRLLSAPTIESKLLAQLNFGQRFQQWITPRHWEWQLLIVDNYCSKVERTIVGGRVPFTLLRVLMRSDEYIQTCWKSS